MSKKKKLHNEVNNLKADKKALEESVNEIVNKNLKILLSEDINEIVDRNFSKIYKEELEKYSFSMSNKTTCKKEYNITLRKSFLPILVASAITLSTIGGYAIYHRDNLEAFTKYHGNEITYSISYIDNKNYVWSEPIALSKDPKIDFFITAKVPLEDTENLVRVCNADFYGSDYEYSDFLYMPTEEIVKHWNYDDFYEESIVRDPELKEAITEVGVVTKGISEYKMSDVKKEGLAAPGYKKLSIPSAVIMGLGSVLSGVFAHVGQLSVDRENYKQAKEDLKIQKQKVKVFKNRKYK